jgi:hypothetical protein
MAVPDSVSQHEPDLHKRRSTRIMQAVPLTVTGVDALGRPFQERTSTLLINCHGCRYQSKHYVLKNMWVTLEVPHHESGREPHLSRGRVTWIQRPRTVRELFQIGVELEIPGNIWGIAFPPPDWFPAPESEVPTLPAPGMSLPAEPDSSGEDWSTPGEPAPPGNVLVMGAPTEAPAGTQDMALHLARQVAKMVGEAKQQIQATVREAALKSVSQEIKPLLSALESQLASAAGKAVQSAIEDHAKIWMDRACERIELQARASSEGLREAWGRELDQRIEDAQTLTAARMATLEQAEQESFQTALNASVEAAIDRLHQSTGAAAERAEQARAQFEKSRQELRATVEEATRRWEQVLSGRTTGAAAQMEKLQAAANNLTSQIQSAIEQGERTWRSRMESDMGAAQKRSAELAAAAADQAVKAASEQIAKESLKELQSLRTQFNQQSTELQIHAEDVHSQARKGLADLHKEWTEEAARGRAALVDIQQAGMRAMEAAQVVEHVQQTAATNLEKKVGELLDSAAHKLEAHTETAASGISHRLEPILEAATAQSIAKLGEQLQNELAPQIQRARNILQRLSAGSAAVEDTLRTQQEQLWQASARFVQEAAAHLQENAAGAQKEWQEAARVAMAKWVEDLDTRATDITHTAIETLYKSANWYEKKVHTQMQASLDKGLDQAAESLRARAGEMSGLFASELDHYSRSFVEHSKGQLEESAKEAVDQTQQKISEAAETASLEMGDIARRAAQSEIDRFTAALHNAFDQSAAHLEAHSVQVRSRISAETRQSLASLEAELKQRTQEGIAAARKELDLQAAAVRESRRAEMESQEQEFGDMLGKQGDSALNSYQDRLENASNAWLLTTAAKLNQQSDHQIELMVSKAEARLRETFTLVFANIGEALRQRLLDVSLPQSPFPDKSSEDK